MYGLKSDVDLSFFVGRELTSVEVAPFNVQLNFDGPVLSPGVQSLVSIAVQSRVEHSSKGIVREWDGKKNVPISAASLLGLIGSAVVSVQGELDGTLTLEFANGDVVTVFDHEGYEAYQIFNGDQTIYV